ncbi:MAG: proteasome accessory factor PafA2 family protein, partial [Actinomycetes bacterium]
MAGPGGDEQPSARPRRVFGIETEYGISAVGGPVTEDLHPMQLSNHVVKAYAALAPGQPAGWDYETETPLRDSRGYEVARADAHPDSLT